MLCDQTSKVGHGLRRKTVTDSPVRPKAFCGSVMSLISLPFVPRQHVCCAGAVTGPNTVPKMVWSSEPTVAGASPSDPRASLIHRSSGVAGPPGSIPGIEQ